MTRSERLDRIARLRALIESTLALREANHALPTWQDAVAAEHERIELETQVRDAMHALYRGRQSMRDAEWLREQGHCDACASEGQAA